MNQRKTTFRIFVVEDRDDQWNLIERAFTEVLPTAQIVRAASGDEALTLLREYCGHSRDFPHLVLLNLYVPRRENGWQVLQEIRALPSPLNQIPVVMLSSSVMAKDIKEAYRLRCTSYLIKPIVYQEWLDHFQILKTYWFDVVTLPHLTN